MNNKRALVYQRGGGRGGGPSLYGFRPSPEQIEKFIARHFDFELRKGGSELVVCNPFDGDVDYHFNISKTKGLCHDWHGDDWAGPPNPRTGKRNTSFVHFVQLLLNCSYPEAVGAICDACGDAVPSLQDRPGQQWRPPGRLVPPETQGKPLVALPDLSERLLGSSQPTAARAILRWLLLRGVDRIAVERYDIHHAGMDVVWPYYEFETLVYWQTRNMLNKRFNFPDEGKYGVGKGQFLYNFDQVEPAEDLCITESIFGCHTLVHQCLATGGADMTPQQGQKVHLLGPRHGVILAPDNDAAGLRSIVHNATILLERGLKVYYSIPPQQEYVHDGAKKLTKDWNELLQYLKLTNQQVWDVMAARVEKYTLLSKASILNRAAAMEKSRKVIKRDSSPPAH